MQPQNSLAKQGQLGHNRGILQPVMGAAWMPKYLEDVPL